MVLLHYHRCFILELHLVLFRFLFVTDCLLLHILVLNLLNVVVFLVQLIVVLLVIQQKVVLLANYLLVRKEQVLVYLFDGHRCRIVKVTGWR